MCGIAARPILMEAIHDEKRLSNDKSILLFAESPGHSVKGLPPADVTDGISMGLERLLQLISIVPAVYGRSGRPGGVQSVQLAFSVGKVSRDEGVKGVTRGQGFFNTDSKTVIADRVCTAVGFR